MKTSTMIMGVISTIAVMIGFLTGDWWTFALGVQGEICALLWAIYEKME